MISKQAVSGNSSAEKYPSFSGKRHPRWLPSTVLFSACSTWTRSMGELRAVHGPMTELRAQQLLADRQLQRINESGPLARRVASRTLCINLSFLHKNPKQQFTQAHSFAKLCTSSIRASMRVNPFCSTHAEFFLVAVISGSAAHDQVCYPR